MIQDGTPTISIGSQITQNLPRKRAMATAPISREVFASLAESAGLKLSERQIDEMHAVFPRIQAMAERVRAGGARPVAAELAVIFKPSTK
jgi:hypothetical protein